MRGNICFDVFFSSCNHNIYIVIVTRLFKSELISFKKICLLFIEMIDWIDIFEFTNQEAK